MTQLLLIVGLWLGVMMGAAPIARSEVVVSTAFEQELFVALKQDARMISYYKTLTPEQVSIVAKYYTMGKERLLDEKALQWLAKDLVNYFYKLWMLSEYIKNSDDKYLTS